MPEITFQQCRSGRAMLEISQQELAAAANVGLETVRTFESGIAKPTANSLRSIRLALERAGIDLLSDAGAGPGVRLSRRYLTRKGPKR
jgi:DNA-binding transcriptional regulator YiaG